MHRNHAASRRLPRSAARRRRKPSSSGGLSYGRGPRVHQRTWTAPKVVLLSCAALALLVYYRSKPAPPGPAHGGGGGGGGRAGQNNAVGVSTFPSAGVGIDPWRGADSFVGGNGTAVGEGDRERWRRLAGWGDVPLSDLEDWVPLGPDPRGCLPRTSARPEAQPHVLVGWGFGSPELTLYTYRSLESILHVYPGAHVKVITIGPRYAYFYKWANIIALTQFQKYSKRGYDVKVEVYFGKMQANTIVKGRAIPGHKWWKRNEDPLLFGKGMKISTFQAVRDAVPDAFVTLYLALLELYKHGGIYVDLTTFFVRPLPSDLDGFVAGGQGPSDGAEWDCSTPTTGGRRQLPFVMQYHAPQHPVVACVLGEYDEEVSTLNECIALSKGGGYGGMNCVLEALQTCTESTGLTNNLRLSRVVEWHGCSEETAVGYTRASSTGTSGMDTLEAVAGIPPRVLPLPSDGGEDDGNDLSVPTERLPPGDTAGASTARSIKGLLSKPGEGGEEEDSSTPEEAKGLLSPSSSTDEGEGDDGETAERVAPSISTGGTAAPGQTRAGGEEAESSGGGDIPDQLAASLTDNDDDDEAQVGEITTTADNNKEAGDDTGAESQSQEQEAEEVVEEPKLAASEPNDDGDDGSAAAADGEGTSGGATPAPGGPQTEDELFGALFAAGVGGGGEGQGDEEEVEVVGSRASVSSPTADVDTADVDADAAVQEERRQDIRRRRLANAAGAGAGAAAGATAGAAAGASIMDGGERVEVGGAGTGASRALSGGRQQAQGTSASVTPDRVSLLWMGPQATDGSWRAPDHDSLWAEAFSRLRLTRWKPQQVAVSCQIPCGHWDTLSPEGSKASEEAKAQASFQCAPRVFVPGTQKGASTFLFHAISWHPQMVQPLRGAHGFKETGRYSPGVATGPQQLGLRLAAFPFIEEHENFATGDGSVIYMLHSMQTPEAIRADNPHAKIVFALRDPVARAWSDFRFLWGVYQKQEGFPSVIEASLDKTRACFEGHMGEDPRPFDYGDGGPGQLVVPAEEEEAIQHFFSRCSAVKDPGQIVRKGIYYYQVLHWMRVFGRDNVMIVDSADLKSRQEETIEEVYRFLGLCPVDISKLEPENVTNSPNIPAHMKITAESYKALQDFYEPFNKKLYKLLGRDLGWEKNAFKPRRR